MGLFCFLRKYSIKMDRCPRGSFYLKDLYLEKKTIPFP
jgi:hypothetical protein